MAGALKTLYGALAASSFLSGVSLVYGEEEVHDQSQALPMVVIVPVGGEVQSNGYEGNGDPAVERRWSVLEQIDLYLWAFDTTPGAGPVDHADATETLRANVLSALQDQRAQYTDVASVSYGLAFVPQRETWKQMEGAFVRYGRALVLSVVAEITVAMPVPAEATITETDITTSITAGP
jgi:hypothetical protein